MTTDQLTTAVSGAAAADIAALLDAVTPTVFARLVKRSSDRQIRDLMGSDLRTPILDRIMTGMVDSFCPERARGVQAVVHWKVLDRPGGGYDHFEQVVRDGTCVATNQPQHEPDVALKAKPVDFANIICGFANTKLAVARGKLKISGDLNLARKVDTWFDKPQL
ncbi:MAG: SCP2 sterol-binding domain-containing protein [Actinomycetota bacterium]|nr:SCP2 sterol-binding domain-containing protein [Actinomycetota bacterium]